MHSRDGIETRTLRRSSDGVPTGTTRPDESQDSFLRSQKPMERHLGYQFWWEPEVANFEMDPVGEGLAAE